MNFTEINCENLNMNAFKSIGKDWMLITSGNKEKFNTMTASWGSIGVLWNKNIATIFVRPQRYTFEFLEKNDIYTLSFFDDEFKKELAFCGRNSGKDLDKVKSTGLAPIFDDNFTFFSQAKLVFVCKKIYTDFIKPDNFLDDSIKINYENNDYHKMYVGEIMKCLVKK